METFFIPLFVSNSVTENEQFMQVNKEHKIEYESQAWHF